MASGPSRHVEKSPVFPAGERGKAPTEPLAERTPLAGGRTLEPSLRDRMERSFGQSFAGVRVHDDARAHSASESYGARAFTQGNDIAFGRGQYQPGTTDGDRLVAHELAHVVQSGGASAAPSSGVAAKTDVSRAHEPAELQADAAAERAVRGEPAGVTSWGASAWSLRQRIMRKAEAGFGSMSAPTPISNVDAKGGEATEAGAVAEPTGRNAAEREPSEGTSAEGEGSRQKKKKKRPGETTPEAEAVDEERALAGNAKPVGFDGEPERGERATPSRGPAREEKATSEREGSAERASRARAEKPATSREREPARTLEPKQGEAVAQGAHAASEPKAAGAAEPIAGAPPEATLRGRLERRFSGEAADERGAKEGAGATEGKEEGAKAARVPKDATGEKKERGRGKGEKADKERGGAKGEARGEAVGGGPAAGAGPARALAEACAPAGPVGAAAGAKAPAATGGAGGIPSVAGGGGGGGGGGGEAEDKGAASTEKQLEEKQPEEERAAEEARDQEEDEVAASPTGEPTPDNQPATADEGARAQAGHDGSGGEGMPDGDLALDGGGGAGEATASQVNAAEEPPNPTPAENKQREENAQAEAQSRETDEASQAESPEPEAQEPSREDGELSPAERDAGVAAASEDVGGGGGEGGGGGGGGGAVPEKPAPAPPDVSAQEPKAAIGSLKGLSPIAIKGALGGLSSAVGKSVSEKQEELAASPPTLDAPTGMAPKAGPPKEHAESKGGDKEKNEKVAEGEAVPVEEPEPTPNAPPSPVEDISAPSVNEASEGEMSEDEAARMGSAVENIPTNADEVSTDGGPPPTLALEGDADPAQMGAQREAIDQKVSAAHAKAAGETSVPMGEDEIAPQAADETLTAKISGGAGSGGGGAGGGEATPDEETASIVAQEKKQDELDAAADKGAEDMAEEEQQHEEETEAEKQRTMDEAAKADQQAASDQRAEKTAAQRFVAKKRGQWRDEQSAAVEKSQTDAQKKETETGGEIETQREKADADAKEHIESGERDAKKEKSKKEAEAEAERAKAKKQSSGFFGWLASKAKALFNKIKAAIKSIMKALRDVVKGLIDAAKKLAVAAIEAARKVAVAAIRAAGDAIIAIGDVALAAFPEAREKFRGYINEKVADAEDAVNQLADDLKKGVEALLDALGEFLDKALQLLEKAMLAVVDAYAKVVDTIIKAAEAIAKAFGIFFALIKDIASGPGRWISNLGASVVDGIKNHLVKAMKDAISGWFKSKVEEVIGLPVDLMKALLSGGIDLDAIGKIVWSALKTAIPTILVQLLIEKLVAMIVPAAGAVMAIVEGLQAAWGTISRIIAAIDKFVTFLKAVKGGGAGPSFAQAVAAGAVAVIDFVANWLLVRLMKPAKKVAGKLAAMAKRILAKLKKGLKKVGKKIKGAFKKAAAKVKGVFKRKKGGKKKPGKKKEKKKETLAEKRARLDRAVAEVKQFTSGKKRLGLILKAQLLRIRFKHKLTSLVAKATSPGKYSIRATVNPTTVFTATAITDAAVAFAKKLAVLTVTGIQQLRAKYKALAPKGFTAGDRRAVAGKESYEITLTGDGKTELVGKFEKFTNEGQLAEKPGPKTERDEEHNTKIRNVIASYRRRGYRLISGGESAGAVGGRQEVELDIPGTEGRTRRADAVFEKISGPNPKEKVYVNVGKGFLRDRGEFKKGDPIKREREAAEDIKKVAEKEGAKFKFYAYNV